MTMSSGMRGVCEQQKKHNGALFTPSSTLFAKEIKLRRKHQGLPVYDGGEIYRIKYYQYSLQTINFQKLKLNHESI
jgi:hypothetical protein